MHKNALSSVDGLKSAPEHFIYEKVAFSHIRPGPNNTGVQCVDNVRHYMLSECARSSRRQGLSTCMRITSTVQWQTVDMTCFSKLWMHDAMSNCTTCIAFHSFASKLLHMAALGCIGVAHIICGCPPCQDHLSNCRPAVSLLCFRGSNRHRQEQQRASALLGPPRDRVSCGGLLVSVLGLLPTLLQHSKLQSQQHAAAVGVCHKGSGPP